MRHHTDELFENAFGKPRGGHVDYDWSQGQDLSSSDCDDMDEIEEAMFQDWLGAYEQESTHIQDEGEEFFNMVDAWGPD